MPQRTFGLTTLIGHGHAFSQVLPVTNPAAGAGFTYTNDGSYWELIDTLAFVLVTDSNAANRQVALTVRDGSGAALATLPAASVQTASLTYAYTFARDFATFNTVVGLAVTAPLPTLLLQPTFTLAVTIGSAQAGDQVSAIRVYAERFVTGQAGYLLGVVDDDELREHRAAMRAARG